MAASAASQLGWVWRGSCRIIRSPLPTTEDCEFLPWLNSIVRAFTLYCLTLRREILFPFGVVRVIGHADDQAVTVPPVRAVRCRVVVVVRRGVPVDADIASEVLLAAGVSGFVDRLVAWIATARQVERAGDLLLVRRAAVDPGDHGAALLGTPFEAVTGLQLVPVHLLRLA